MYFPAGSHMFTWLSCVCVCFTGPPTTPTIIDTDIGISTITISWTVLGYDPDNVCGPVMYRVTISGPDINDTDTTDTNMYTFTGLTPNTNYTITITPYNSAGDGTPNTTMGMTLPTGKAIFIMQIKNSIKLSLISNQICTVPWTF